ncbi:uncharacterized protein N7469_006037 [Penicillium citrinum]|uniref:Uncharacterized protein n=1 Tax=Penicillium citrinum TaxID=5077 RepID=A0A9W9NX86_PENCI|nr:uncharacterized protein N7469_006037 [Penicillium citrinum]KAJ5231449.1 hypothetical protein N7469_006037 [Penicillium citrinum]
MGLRGPIFPRVLIPLSPREISGTRAKPRKMSANDAIRETPRAFGHFVGSRQALALSSWVIWHLPESIKVYLVLDDNVLRLLVVDWGGEKEEEPPLS